LCEKIVLVVIDGENGSVGENENENEKEIVIDVQKIVVIVHDLV
jgi:subtilase family serine protease